MDALLGHLMVQLLLAQVQLQRMAVQTAYASEIHAPLFQNGPEDAIRFWANQYHQSPHELIETIRGESNFDPMARGKAGEIGACQILPRAHPEVTVAQMADPDWCIEWMAKQWELGHAHWWVAHWKFEQVVHSI